MVKTGHCSYQEVLRTLPKFVFQVQIGWWRSGLHSWFVCLWNDRFEEYQVLAWLVNIWDGGKSLSPSETGGCAFDR